MTDSTPKPRSTGRPLSLTTLRGGDGPSLTRLVWSLHQANGQDVTAREARAILSQRLGLGDQIAIGRIAERPIAYALWGEGTVARDPHLYLRHFVIDPALTRRGLGRRFLALLYATWPPGWEVRLHCRTPRARAFWHAMGARPANFPARDGLRLIRTPENAR